MVAAVSSRSTRSAPEDIRPPPAKKTKLSQPSSKSRQNGFKALLNGKMPTVNGAKGSQKARVDEATAVVAGGMGGHGDVDMEDAGQEVIEISSAEEESNLSSSDNEEEEGTGAEKQEDLPNGFEAVNGSLNGDVDDIDEEDPAAEGTAEPEELSFGERLQAQQSNRTPNVVDVETTFVGPSAESRALAAASSNRPLSAPSANSLGNVLTQALRTNDPDLLETCFRVIDVETIEATIERLPSQYVATLLQKLAERLHKRPGRAGMLMIWVQWSLAVHGGYLASQPQVVKQLASLNQVLKERASGLQPLLSLKGRLDMLHAQLELRRRNQRRAAKGDEDDEAVIYVEGEEESSSEEEADHDQLLIGNGSKSATKKRIRQASAEDEDESLDDMPTTMNMDEEDEDDEDDEDADEDSEDMLDDEAEETENDTGDDLSEAESDEDMDDGEDVSDSEEDSRPPRRSTVGRAGLSRR